VNPQRQILELVEYGAPLRLPAARLSQANGELLWRAYEPKGYLTVQFPGPKTGGEWELRSGGWVGYLPVSADLGVALRPKVPLGNLFRMLEYAYRLKSFRLMNDLIDSESLGEFYGRLAHILANRVLDRARRGLYRVYIGYRERLPYVRGRLDTLAALRRHWDVSLDCEYEEHTADIEDNQILAWTLLCVARSGVCSEQVQSAVRKAYRAVQGIVAPLPISPRACVRRLYNRLNDDYEPMHGLCRFLLENTGPTHQTGDHTMIPFVVNMAQLFELFVAEWLRAHLPEGLVLKTQEPVPLSEDGLRFEIDLVIYERGADAARCVVDTKYKAPDQPSPDDIAQVIAYAQAKGCTEAILAYPRPLPKPLVTVIGGIRVRSLGFELDGDLGDAGHRFLSALFGNEETAWQDRPEI